MRWSEIGVSVRLAVAVGIRKQKQFGFHALKSWSRWRLSQLATSRSLQIFQYAHGQRRDHYRFAQTTL